MSVRLKSFRLQTESSIKYISNCKQKISSRQKQRLTAAQRTWIKFRDENCEYAKGQFEGGTLAASTYGYCRARVTQERIKDLEGYLKQANL